MIREHPITRARPSAYGSFTVRDEIAIGSSGSVYFATDPATHAPVSIHTIEIPGDWRGREADVVHTLRALCSTKVRHPTIARPVSSGVQGGIPYIVYPHVYGVALATALQHRGPLSLDEVVRFLTPVAAAIDVAAAVGIHHGALSPVDIIVDGDAVTVIRFGLIDALRHAGLTVAIQPLYSSPQRVASAPPTLADDIYSLAAIALAMIVGESFETSGRARSRFRGGGTLLTTSLMSSEESFPGKRHGVDSRLLRVAMSRALSENPAVRQPRAAEFINELRRALVQGARPTLISDESVATVMMFASENDALPAPVEIPRIEPPAPDPVPAPAPHLVMHVPYQPTHQGTGRRQLMVAGIVVAALVIAGAAGYVVLRERGEASLSPAPRVQSDPAPPVQAVSPEQSSAPEPQSPPVADAAPPVAPEPLVITPPPPTPSVPKLEQRAATQPAPSTPPAPVAENGPGSLFVTTYPAGARLYVDGALVGTTPLLMPGLTSGPHPVRLELADKQTWSSAIEIKAYERYRLAVKLEP